MDLVILKGVLLMFKTIPPLAQATLNAHSLNAMLSALKNKKAVHPLLGKHFVYQNSMHIFYRNLNLNLKTTLFLKEHVIVEHIVYPAAAFMEMVYAAAKNIQKHSAFSIKNFQIKAPLLLRQNTKTPLLTLINSMSVNRWQLLIFSQRTDVQGNVIWTEHVSAEIDYKTYQIKKNPIHSISADKTIRFSAKKFYQSIKRAGIAYGPQFQILKTIASSNAKIIATTCLSEDKHYYCYPPIIDACFQLIASDTHGYSQLSQNELCLPISFAEFYVFDSIQQPLHIMIQMLPEPELLEKRLLKANIYMYSVEKQNCVAKIMGYIAKKVTKERLQHSFGSQWL